MEYSFYELIFFVRTVFHAINSSTKMEEQDLDDSVVTASEEWENKNNDLRGCKRLKPGSSTQEEVDEECDDFNSMKNMMKGVLREMKGLRSEVVEIKRELRNEMTAMKEELRKEVGEMVRDEMSRMSVKFEEMLFSVKREMKKEVMSVDKRVDDFSERMKQCEGQIQSMKSDVKENISRAQKEMRDSSQRIESRLKVLDSKSNNFEKREKNLRWKSIDNEARSRRNNLLFHGIREENNENCQKLIENFIKNELKINEPVVIQRAHRLGRPTPSNSIGRRVSQPRPIIVNLLDFRQREVIRSARSGLRHPFGISEDFPFEVRKARESLMPELRELKRNNKKCSIVWPAKLLCEGEIVKEVDITNYCKL